MSCSYYIYSSGKSILNYSFNVAVYIRRTALSKTEKQTAMRCYIYVYLCFAVNVYALRINQITYYVPKDQYINRANSKQNYIFVKWRNFIPTWRETFCTNIFVQYWSILTVQARFLLKKPVWSRFCGSIRSTLLYIMIITCTILVQRTLKYYVWIKFILKNSLWVCLRCVCDCIMHILNRILATAQKTHTIRYL